MKFLIRALSKIVGVVFMVAAFFQWITFDYPDINPFWPGAIFAPGIITQAFNWLFVCILATVGWGFFTLGKYKFNKSSETSSTK